MHATVVGCHGAQGVSSRYLPSDLSRHLPAADAVSQCIPLSPSSPSYHPSYPLPPHTIPHTLLPLIPSLIPSLTLLFRQLRHRENESNASTRGRTEMVRESCRFLSRTLPPSSKVRPLLLSPPVSSLLSPPVSSCLLLSPVSYLLSPLVLSCRFCRFGIKQHVSAAFRNYTRA